MERLLMEFTVGDGYTYSSEVTYPIVYESKEKAIEDFELLLIEKIETLSTLKEIMYVFANQNTSLLKLLQKISADKRMSEKDKTKHNAALCTEIQNLSKDKIVPLEKQINDTETVLFGGQSFELHNFVFTRESDQKTDYTLPTIHTLNEYFAGVEKDLTLSKKIKP